MRQHHATRRRSQPGGAVVRAILLGEAAITPRRRVRMAADIQGIFGYPRGGVYSFAEGDIAALSVLAEREGQHAGEEYGRDLRIGDAYRLIVADVREHGQAVVRLVY